MASASIFNDIKRNDFSYNWRRPQLADQPPLQLNDRIVWISDFGPEHGSVRWIGKLAEMGNSWTVGVDLDNPIGTTDGHWGGRQLFIARPKHGLIISIMALMKEEEFLGVPAAVNTPKQGTPQGKRAEFGLYDNVRYKINNEAPHQAQVPDDDIPFADEVECSQPEVLALQLAANIAAGKAEPIGLNAGANEKLDLEDDQDVYKWYDAMDFGGKKQMRPNKALQSTASMSSLGEMEEISSVISEDDESPKEKGGFLSSIFRWLWKGKPKKRKTTQETEQNLVRVQSGSIHSVTSTSSSFQYVPMDFTLDKKKLNENKKTLEKHTSIELPVDLKGNSDDSSETGTFKIITDTICNPKTTAMSSNDKVDLEEMPTLKLPVPEDAPKKKIFSGGHPPYKSKNVVRSRSTGTYRKKKRQAPLPPNVELKLDQRQEAHDVTDVSNENKKKRIAYVKGKRRAPSPPVKKSQGTNTGLDDHMTTDVQIGTDEIAESKDDESNLSIAEEVSLSSLTSSPSLKVTRTIAVNTTLAKSDGMGSVTSGDIIHSQAKPNTISIATNTTISRATGNSSSKPEMVSTATNTTLVKSDTPSEPNHIKSLLEFPPFPHPRLKMIERKKLFSKCASLNSSPKLKKARSEPGLDIKNSFDSDDDMEFSIGHLGYDISTTTSNEEYRPLSVIKFKQSNLKLNNSKVQENSKNDGVSSKIKDTEKITSLEEIDLVKEDKNEKIDNNLKHPHSIVTEEWKGRGLSTQKLINMFNALSEATLERQEKSRRSSTQIRKTSIDDESTAVSNTQLTSLQKHESNKEAKPILNECLIQNDSKLEKDESNQLTVYFNQTEVSGITDHSLDDQQDEPDDRLLYVNVAPLESDTIVLPQASPRRTVDQESRTYANLRDFHLLQESTSVDLEETETDVNMYENLADLALESLDDEEDDNGKTKLEVALAESESDSDLGEPVVYENVKQIEEALQKETKTSETSIKLSVSVDEDSDDSDLNEHVVYENIREIEKISLQKKDNLQKEIKVAENSVKQHMNINADSDDSDNNEPILYENIRQLEENNLQKKNIPKNEIKIIETSAKQPTNITAYDNATGIYNRENRISDFPKKTSLMEPTLPGIYENIEGIQGQLQPNFKTSDNKSKNVNKLPNASLDTKYRSEEDIKQSLTNQKPNFPSNTPLIKGQSMDLLKDDSFKNDEWENKSDCASAVDRKVRKPEISHQMQMQSISRPYYRSWSGDLNRDDQIFAIRNHDSTLLLQNLPGENQANHITSGFMAANDTEFSYLPNRRVSDTALSCTSLTGPTPPITPRKGGRKYRQRRENEYTKLSQTLPVKKHNYSPGDGRLTHLQDSAVMFKSSNDLKINEHLKSAGDFDGAIKFTPINQNKSFSEIQLITKTESIQKEEKTNENFKINSNISHDSEEKRHFNKFSNVDNYANCASKEGPVSLFSFSNPYYMSANQVKSFTSTDSINSSKPFKTFSSEYKLNSPPFYTSKSNYSSLCEQENKSKDINIQNKASDSSSFIDVTGGVSSSNFNGSHTLITVTVSTTQADTNQNSRLNSMTTSSPLSSPFDVTGKQFANNLPSIKKDTNYDISKQLVIKTEERPSSKKDLHYSSSKKVENADDKLKHPSKEQHYNDSVKLAANTNEITAPKRGKIYCTSKSFVKNTEEKPLIRKELTYDLTEKLVTTDELTSAPKIEQIYSSKNLVLTNEAKLSSKKFTSKDISKKLDPKNDPRSSVHVNKEHLITDKENDEAPKTIPRTKNKNTSHYQDVQQGKLVLERVKGPGYQNYLKIVEGDSPNIATITEPGEIAESDKQYSSTDNSKGARKKSGKALKSGLTKSEKKLSSKSNSVETISILEKISETSDSPQNLTNDSDFSNSKFPQHSPKLPKPPSVNRSMKQEAMKKRSNTVPTSIWPESYEILAPELVKLKAKLQGNPETGELSGLLQKDVGTLQINKLLRKLEVAIQKGQHEQASVLAKDLAMLKVSCSVIRNKPKNLPTNPESISINLFVEDRSSHIGPINLHVVPSMTVGQLKRKIEQQFEFPAELQRWILGKKLASNDEATLASYDVVTNGCPVFLYLMETDPDVVGRYRQRLEMYLRALEEFEDNMEDEYPVIEKRLKPRPSPRSTVGTPIPKPRTNPKIYSQVANKQNHNAEINTPKENSLSIIGWPCPACTFVNIPTRPGCHVCGENRPEDFVIPEGYEVLPDEAERIQKEKELEDKLKKTQAEEREANYRRLLELDDVDVVINDEEFECPVCFNDVQQGDGVRLRDCLHMFCRICIENAVQFSEVAEVKCPYMDDHYSCPSVIQDREVRALVSPEIYERYLLKSMIAAESQAANSFHCKTADCRGWCVYEDNVNDFLCPVCNHTNCLTCQVIHEGLNCRQYQDKVEYDAASSEEAKKTKDALDQMLEEGQAMRCPKCQVILMKKWGCDWLKCSMCQTEICWVTKGPRWGPAGQGDTSGGCRCGVNGVRCHPKCNYCH